MLTSREVSIDARRWPQHQTKAWSKRHGGVPYGGREGQAAR